MVNYLFHVIFVCILGTQWLDINNVPEKCLWPDKTFLSTLFLMKPFKAYFLFDDDNILFYKYYES